MAEVTMTLPGALLVRLDAYAAARGLTRSAVLCDLAEAPLGEGGRLLADRMAALDGQAAHHGGDAAAVLESERPA
jgi:hypothetical protein